MRSLPNGTRRALRVVVTAVTAALVFFASAVPAWAMTLTFVRHGESEANAAGIIDTKVPGPPLTPTGVVQAKQKAALLAENGYDGIYASSMLRAQQTAYALLDQLGLSHDALTVLDGLREISAGIWEGSSQDEGIGRLGYAIPPVLWTLGLRSVPILGSEDGNEFDARVDDAVRQIADSGDQNAVAFGHGATIMFWVMMNVDNPDLSLLLSHQLNNTDDVVIKGSLDEGWTLVSWAGVPVAANPSLFTKLFVDFRELIVAPQTAQYNIGKAFATSDLTKIANTTWEGIVDVATTTLNFVPKVISDIAGSTSSPAPQTLQSVSAAAPLANKNASAKALDIDPVELPRSLTALTKAGKTNGAADPNNGNLARSGKAAVTPTRHDQGVQTPAATSTATSTQPADAGTGASPSIGVPGARANAA